MKKISGVYLIRCTMQGGGKVYVGGSTDVMTRWAKHVYELEAGMHKNRHLQAAWKKYGGAAFTFQVVEKTDAVLEAEQRWLTGLSATWPRGFNMCPSTKSVAGIKRSDETKAKMSAALKGRTFSTATRKKMSEVAKGRRSPRRGVTLSPETRKKVSESLRAFHRRAR